LERGEQERSGIRSLKVGYNKIFGYYIEVTKPNLARVPEHYARRQTLVNAERFVTPELKEQEARILTAETRIEELERELFQALLRRIGELGPVLVEAVVWVAELDLVQALAELAAERDWSRPSFVGDERLLIDGGRHPVLEGILPSGEFVPNDCSLGQDARVLLVTGPNMAGKSTYLRQVALIVLLAQVGSFVPARVAQLGLVDRIFTRVGSHDDLAAGASTFLVEMAETANILRHATERSLVVLDEVGRGTSTHDGLCIARAVLEHLHDVVGARTLFATHYHELTTLAEELSALHNLTVAVDEDDDRLAFLYRVVPGAANRSYGVQVARLAGLPSVVTDRAAELLRALEAPAQNGHVASPESLATLLNPPDGSEHIDRDVLGPLHFREWQIPYETSGDAEPEGTTRLFGELLGLDLSSVTPLQALNLLHELQASARASVPWPPEVTSRGARVVRPANDSGPVR
jgi:DNA mismatch repair protein MutS